MKGYVETTLLWHQKFNMKYFLVLFYAKNFHKNGSDFYHSGKCKEFKETFEYYLSVSKKIILISKKVFGNIKNISTGILNNEFVNITFNVEDYIFDIKVHYFGNGIKITCK